MTEFIKAKVVEAKAGTPVNGAANGSTTGLVAPTAGHIAQGGPTSPRRCNATAARTGAPCRRLATPGLPYCAKHKPAPAGPPAWQGYRDHPDFDLPWTRHSYLMALEDVGHPDPDDPLNFATEIPKLRAFLVEHYQDLAWVERAEGMSPEQREQERQALYPVWREVANMTAPGTMLSSEKGSAVSAIGTHVISDNGRRPAPKPAPSVKKPVLDPADDPRLADSIEEMMRREFRRSVAAPAPERRDLHRMKEDDLF